MNAAEVQHRTNLFSAAEGRAQDSVLVVSQFPSPARAPIHYLPLTTLHILPLPEPSCVSHLDQAETGSTPALRF